MAASSEWNKNLQLQESIVAKNLLPGNNNINGDHNENVNQGFSGIEDWIAERYKNEKGSAPRFIDTPKTRSLMSKIIQQNKEAEKDAEVAEKMGLQLSQKYLEKTKELNSLLSEAVIQDVNPEDLQRVDKLASTANSMKLKLPTLTNFLFGLYDLNEKKMKQDESDLIKNYEISELSQKISNIMHKNETLKREIKRLETTSNDQQISVLTKSCKFLTTKSKEYKDRIQQSKKQLKSIGYNASISHGQLVEKAERKQELEEKLKKITSQLGTYQDLPADEIVARLKIEEAKKELTQLQKDFDALLDAIC